jgi:type 1 fimbria pilin
MIQDLLNQNQQIYPNTLNSPKTFYKNLPQSNQQITLVQRYEKPTESNTYEEPPRFHQRLTNSF